MKKILTFCTLIFLAGCVQPPAKADKSDVVMTKPVVVKNWDMWSLVIVELDKNQKPTNKFEIPLNRTSEISKAKAPKILINTFDDNNSERLLKISCQDVIITQKFSDPNQLPGWAAQIECFKKNYYFIINSH